MKASVLVSALATLGAASAQNIRGLDPALDAQYSGETFTCLDGSATIPISAVNDDYCDCVDGSDEPGTSACEGRPAAGFYCENKGHIPGRILAGRVNDGLCDPECCDGSDEWATGACPDRCEEIAKAYREKTEAAAKIRRTGAKIRSTYVSFAVKEKKRLEEEIVAKKAEIGEKEEKVAETKAALERAEAQSRDDLEKKKQTPLFQSLEKHRDAATRVRTQLDNTKKDLDTVLAILEDLSKGYNPNGQDMAVKAAVFGYRELIGKADETTTERATETATEAVEGEGEKTETETPKAPEVKLYTLQKPEGEIPRWELDGVLRQDLESLLVSQDTDDDDDEGLLYKIEEYIPDFAFDYYDTAREWLLSALTDYGVLKRKDVVNDGPHVSAARESHNNAERELRDLNSGISNAENTLRRLSETNDFGLQGEWKKLEGTCIDTVAGDYTYELCFFGSAKQKSNKDHGSTALGSWGEWNISAEAGSPEYYTKQRYTNGARCWNGPMRSVNVELSCGTANAITSVTEPEKCEYKFKVTTPALCLPLEGSEKQQKDEL